MSIPNTTTWEIAANFMDNVAGEVAQFLYLTINEPDVDKFTKQYTESIEGVTKKIFAVMCEEFGITEVEEPQESDE